MATIGVRDLYGADVTEGIEGAPDTYGTPKRIAKAIQVDLEVETADATLYADDAVDESANEFVKGTLTLSINDLPVEMQKWLLSQKQDEDGIIYANVDDLPTYKAIGFRAKKANGQFRYVWLYKVKFAIPKESYKTKGEGMEFTTPEIEGTFIARPDGNWKADYVGMTTSAVAQAWFTQVREPSKQAA
jgi:phi13 family phage major tail protein